MNHDSFVESMERIRSGVRHAHTSVCESGPWFSTVLLLAAAAIVLNPLTLAAQSELSSDGGAERTDHRLPDSDDVTRRSDLSEDGLAELGLAAPELTVQSFDGGNLTLDEFADAEVVVLVFTCTTCPVANAYESRFQEFAESYADKKVAFVAVNSSAREDLESVQQRIRDRGLTYVRGFEATGKTAREYGARVTPHCFVLDQDRKLVYKGAFDDQWRSAPKVHYVREVVDSLLAGGQPRFRETKAVGCTIKFRRR